MNGGKGCSGYAFTRTRTEQAQRWLLVKMDGHEADARRNPVRSEPESVLSGRTLEQIREDHE